MSKQHILGRLALNPFINLFFLSFFCIYVSSYLFAIIEKIFSPVQLLPHSKQPSYMTPMTRSLRAWGGKILCLCPQIVYSSLESPVFFTPKLGELCPHLCRERSSKQPLAACHWLLGGKESESAFILFSDSVTSACHLFASLLL